METLFTNKKFIKTITGLAGVLTLLTIMLFVNAIKENRYIGGGSGTLSTISVTGEGEVSAVSDIASLSLTLSKDGTTAKEAQNLLNEQVTKSLGYLKKENIEDKDIKSEYGGVNPKYSYETVACITYPCPERSQKIIGYTATQSIVVKIRDVDNANKVRTGLADLGISNISGPDFSIDDKDQLNSEARARAIEDARAKAKVLAKQLHVRLGDVVSFSEGGVGYPMMYAEKTMSAGDAMVSPPAPTLPKGENKITSNVTITYEIR